jgi:hypothetical protein
VLVVEVLVVAVLAARISTANTAKAPDHLTANAAPRAAPVAKRQGLHIGDSGGEVAAISPSAPGAARASAAASASACRR